MRVYLLRNNKKYKGENMDIKKIIVAIMTIAFIISLFSGCTSFDTPTGKAITEEGEEEEGSVKIGYLPAAQGLPLFLAQDNGMFEKEGINVELIKFDSPNLLVQALLSGELDIGAPSTAAGI